MGSEWIYDNKLRITDNGFIRDALHFRVDTSQRDVNEFRRRRRMGNDKMIETGSRFIRQTNRGQGSKLKILIPIIILFFFASYASAEYLGEFKAGALVLYTANFHSDQGTIQDPTAPEAQLRNAAGSWSDLSAPTKQNSKTGFYGGVVDTSGYAVGQYVIRMAGTVTTAKTVATVFSFTIVTNIESDTYAAVGSPMQAGTKVQLNSSQPDYAPAKAGDAMTLTSPYDSAKSAASQSSVDIIKSHLIITQKAINDASPSKTKFITTLPQTDNNYWNNGALLFTSGVNAGQIRSIKSYDGATKETTLNTALVNTPGNGDTFSVIMARAFKLAGLEAQEIRDSMKLAASAGDPADGSVDKHIDDIQAQTDQFSFTEGKVNAYAAVSEDAIATAVDSKLSLYHGEGLWGGFSASDFWSYNDRKLTSALTDEETPRDMASTGAADPSAIWHYVERSLTEAPIILPSLQSSPYSTTATQKQTLPVIAGNTPTITWTFGQNYSGWTMQFGCKKQVGDAQPYSISLRDATWIDATKGQGAIDLSASDTNEVTKHICDVKLEKGGKGLTAGRFILDVQPAVIK